MAKFVHDQLRDGMYKELGLATKKSDDLARLRKTEWCSEFEQLMRNRLIMGAMRYAPLAESMKSDGSKFTLEKILARIRQAVDGYEKDGNGEHLVDCANVCLVEFMRQTHPEYHFSAHDRKD